MTILCADNNGRHNNNKKRLPTFQPPCNVKPPHFIPSNGSGRVCVCVCVCVCVWWGGGGGLEMIYEHLTLSRVFILCATAPSPRVTSGGDQASGRAIKKGG